MKRFMIIGAILAGVAVSVLFTHNEVFAPPPPPEGYKFALVKFNVEDGTVDSVKGVKDDGTEVPGADVVVGSSQMRGIHARPGGFKFVTEILHATTNPETCIYIDMGGWYVKICR
jgi:hypothetical protein